MERQRMNAVALAALVTMGWACSNEEVLTQESGVLRIASVGIEDAAETRATSLASTMVNSLDNGAKLGLWVVGAEGNDPAYSYNGKTYQNLKLTKQDGKWAFDDVSIVLTDATATVTAMSPYYYLNTTTVSLTGDDDYLFGKAENVSLSNPTVSLSMKHVRAILRIIVKADGYTGAGNLTAGTVTGSDLCKEGKLNMQTGAVTKTDNAANKKIGLTGGSIAEGNTLTTEAYFLPATSMLTMSVTVDGHTYTKEVASKDYEAGHVYVYTLKVSDVAMSVEDSNVSLDTWTEESNENVDMTN